MQAIFDVFLVFVVANSFCSVAPIIQIVAEIPEELLGLRTDAARKAARLQKCTALRQFYKN